MNENFYSDILDTAQKSSVVSSQLHYKMSSYTGNFEPAFWTPPYYWSFELPELIHCGGFGFTSSTQWGGLVPKDFEWYYIRDDYTLVLEKSVTGNNQLSWYYTRRFKPTKHRGMLLKVLSTFNYSGPDLSENSYEDFGLSFQVAGIYAGEFASN